MAARRILVIVPCYNEAGNVGALLEELRDTPAQLDALVDVVVIDDGSTDATSEIASRLAPTVRLCRNLGIGGSIQTGVKLALRRDYDACIQVDGDGQHPPSQLAQLLECHARTGAQVVVGSRFLGGKGFQSTFLRRLGIGLISSTLRLLYGKEITDPTSGLRLFDREAIRLFARDYPVDFPEPVSLGLALQRRMRVEEVQVEMRPRLHGQSSISGFDTASYVFRVLTQIALVRLGFR